MAGLQGIKTVLAGVIVHGFANFVFFFCTNQVRHDTNLNIEVIRRTLLKYEADRGKLSPNLHLQMDSARDNKFKSVLAFAAYLVEIGYVQRVFLSYLLAGYSHEDID